MSENIPSLNEEIICRFKALYLGTSVYVNPQNKKFNETSLNLAQLQDTIAERYPTDGSTYVKGIQTYLSIYPSGIQFEHISCKETASLSAIFYYPIKSLVYCGALRYVDNSNDRRSKQLQFVPVDTEIAQKNDNVKNPPLFVVFLKAIDHNTNKQVVECFVFLVGMVKTAMKLIEGCQKAFNGSRETMMDFYKTYGHIPVVFCMKNDLSNTDKRMLIKKFDEKGYFYAIEHTPIELFQLFEENESSYETTSRERKKSSNEKIEQIYSEVRNKKGEHMSEKHNNVIQLSNPKVKYDEPNEKKVMIDPYEKSDNLLKVEKRVDPITGQNIYVRYLAESLNKPKTYDLPNQVYESESDGACQNCDSDEETKKPSPIIIRQEKTPSPIIVEKYIKKKAPQVIIKEIHVHEPAAPPVKIIQTMDNQYNGESEAGNPYDSNRPPNILGPRAINGYAGPSTIPRSSAAPRIRMINPNNVPLTGNCNAYTDVRSLLNKAYGYPGFEYNAENKFAQERYPVYTTLNRNYVFNSRRQPETEYRKFANNVYDYTLKPRRLFSDIPTTQRNYSSLKPNEVRRFSTGYPKNDTYDKYHTTRPSNQRKVYTDHSKPRMPENASFRSRPAVNSEPYDLNKTKMYPRNASMGKTDTRKSYNY